jgi:hypothetical protein
LIKAVELKSEKESLTYHRGPELFQLDINHLESLVVLDELDSEADKKERRVRAGCRAPNAPGIVPLTPGLKQGSSKLFDIFNPTRRMALVFAQSDEDIIPYIPALQEYSPGTMYTAVIVPKRYTHASKDVPVCESGITVSLDG